MERTNDIRLQRSKITLVITNNLLKYSIKEMYLIQICEQRLSVLVSLLKELILLNLSKSGYLLSWQLSDFSSLIIVDKLSCR